KTSTTRRASAGLSSPKSAAPATASSAIVSTATDEHQAAHRVPGLGRSRAPRRELAKRAPARSLLDRRDALRAVRRRGAGRAPRLFAPAPRRHHAAPALASRRRAPPAAVARRAALGPESELDRGSRRLAHRASFRRL